MNVPANMKTNKASLVYESLWIVNQGFEQILRELAQLQKSNWFRGRRVIKSVDLAVRETQAWATFEILEVLHERVEREWTRLGRMRDRQEKADDARTPAEDS